MAQIEELSASAAALKSVDQIQSILMFLHRSEDLCEHVDSFMQMLSIVQPKDDPLFIIAPLLSDELCETDTFRLEIFLDLLIIYCDHAGKTTYLGIICLMHSYVQEFGPDI